MSLNIIGATMEIEAAAIKKLFLSVTGGHIL